MHSLLGLIALILTLIVGISGIVLIHFMFRVVDKNWTKEERVTKIARFHRKCGYVMLLLGNIVVSGGITTYLLAIGSGFEAIVGFTSLALYIAIVVKMEREYRSKHS